MGRSRHPDPTAAKSFYTELFGWEAADLAGEGGTTNGSIHLQSEEERAAPPNWLVYFATADLEATASNVGELGGQVMVPPLDVPAPDAGESPGRVSVVTDPQGAAFGLFEGELDP